MSARPPNVRPYPIHPAASGWIALRPRRSLWQRVVDAAHWLLVKVSGQPDTWETPQ